ncbi:MAG TPA: hypothetical protein VK741_02675 [Acetobacteraceae bacterium]|jgi:hypothetical protein|nr:hypothetical protein [Acetobacteraceae bacterium]
MMLSLPRMFSLFNGLPHLPRRRAELIEVSDRRPPQAGTESPGFLHSGFVPFEPDLTQEIRQALGEQAARRAGDLS